MRRTLIPLLLLVPLLASGIAGADEPRGVAVGTYYDDNFAYASGGTCAGSLHGDLRLAGQFWFGRLWRGIVQGTYVGDSCSASNPAGADVINEYRFGGRNPFNGARVDGSCSGTATPDGSWTKFRLTCSGTQTIGGVTMSGVMGIVVTFRRVSTCLPEPFCSGEAGGPPPPENGVFGGVFSKTT